MTTQAIQKVLSSPCASDWLKDACKALLLRDAVQAANEAELLAELFRGRCNLLLKRAQLEASRKACASQGEFGATMFS